MATHKSGNQLDLIYTRHCSTDHVLVTPLYTSDHFLLTLNINMIPDTTHTPPHVTIHSLSISPSKTARNLGVVIDVKLNFSDHIAKTARSCRFALYNIRKIRPFLSEHATQLLVQALVLSRLDYCNALLAGLPANSIKPLQLIQNATARLIFNEPKRTHITPLFINFFSFNFFFVVPHYQTSNMIEKMGQHVLGNLGQSSNGGNMHLGTL